MTLFGPPERLRMSRHLAPFRPRGTLRLRDRRARVVVHVRTAALTGLVSAHSDAANEQGYLCLGRRLRHGRWWIVCLERLVWLAEGTPHSVALPARAKADAVAAWPMWQVVGWAHTHPRLGVFWSHTDRENCSAFGRFSVNLVYDPQRGELGIALGTRFLFRGRARLLGRGVPCHHTAGAAQLDGGDP